MLKKQNLEKLEQMANDLSVLATMLEWGVEWFEEVFGDHESAQIHSHELRASAAICRKIANDLADIGDFKNE